MNGTASGGNGPNGSQGVAGTGTATGTTANGAGKSPEITSSMLPEVPSAPYNGTLMVGETLPGTFTYYPVPNENAYSYAIINNHRVLIDRDSHRIVRVMP